MSCCLKESEYLNMKLNWDQATAEEKQIVRDYRICRGVLKKQQLESKNDYHEMVANNMYSEI